MEEREELEQDGKRLRIFDREIKETFDKNLEDCLADFIDKYDIKDTGEHYILVKFVQSIKEKLR